jgi:secreted PhoX family phosphatase
VRGVIGPKGGAATPWGTLLVAEGDPLPWLARLRGLDPAFQDARRFGWVVELDPLDPSSVPSKRTALGRRAHGDAAAARARDGRAVVYLTDHRPFGFLFRFVSREAAGPDALDAGTLAAARIEGPNIRWLPLPEGAVLDPQGAAEAAGASAFDQPSGVTVSPANGRLYLACRGNAQRPPHRTDTLNPRAGNAAGHVVEILPDNDDHAAESAEARVFLLGADTMGGVRTPGPVPPTTWPEQPDTLHADARGRLWIGTDRGGRVGSAPDALFGADLAGPGRGMPLPLYGAARAASVGGAATTPDGEALISLARTPGAEPGASFERPSTRWPQLDPNIPPRSAVLLFARMRGGPVGG